MNNQKYPVYSFQGKRLLKEYIKAFNGGSIFNVPLSTRAKLVQRNRERRRQLRQQQQSLQSRSQPQPQQDNSRIDDFVRLDQESQRFIDTVNVHSNIAFTY